jgi:hypothetical protein
MKYKLIKEYPGSPELGTEVEKDNLSKSYFYRNGDKRWCVLDNHVEDNPEYWEKVNENLWYAVFEKPYMQDDKEYFATWNIYMIETLDTQSTDRHLFKTREEAQEFILYNKPCLSYDDVCKMFGYSREFNGDIITFRISEKSLKEFVKSKL